MTDHFHVTSPICVTTVTPCVPEVSLLDRLWQSIKPFSELGSSPGHSQGVQRVLFFGQLGLLDKEVDFSLLRVFL